MTGSRRRTLAVSLKSYLGQQQTRAWLAQIADECDRHPEVDTVVFPVATMLAEAVESGRRHGFVIGAQDVSVYPAGAYTGELPASLLAEIGVRYVEIAHAERVHLMGESPETITAKLRATIEQSLVPLVCVGEGVLGNRTPMPEQEAMIEVLTQVKRVQAVTGEVPLVFAYEPIWAIGADQPASVEHIRAIARSIRSAVNEQDVIIYGGTAGPGLYDQLSDCLDGLFLGRRAHDPRAFGAVLSELAAIS